MSDEAFRDCGCVGFAECSQCNVALVHDCADCVRMLEAGHVCTTNAQLNIALVVVSELLTCIDSRAHLWTEQQRAVSAAKQLLREHGWEVAT